MRTATIAVFAVGLTVLPHVGVSQTKAGAVVAVVDGQPVSQADLNARLGDRLLRLKTEAYNIELSTLNQIIDDLLLAQEAANRQMSSDALLRNEVTDKIPHVSQAEARAVVETSQAAYQRLSPDEALRTVIADLNRRRSNQLRTDFIAGLRASHSFEVRLEQPRLARPLSGGHSVGSDRAPVSILEFSDFQCPYCGNLSTALDRVTKEYGSKIRLTYKHFPLPNHPQAQKAAEASLCAAEQGRFWEMHDRLFSDQRLLATGAFSELAGRAGLDVQMFDHCFQAGRFRNEVARDMLEGVSIGIISTPTFFLNGKMFVGAKSYETLRELVEAELRKTDSRVQ